MIPIDAVLFDIDQTLITSNVGIAVTATCRKISAHFPQFTADELAESNKRMWDKHGLRLIDEFTNGIRNGFTITTEAWRLSLAGCGCFEESIINFTTKTYIEEESETFRLFDDVLPLLDFLDSARIPVGIITNGAGDTQISKLKVTRILDRFNPVIASGEVKTAKPDQRIFELAVKKLGGSPDRTWYVGDNPETDIAGANAAGIKSIWINRSKRELREGEPVPHKQILSLTELLTLLEKP